MNPELLAQIMPRAPAAWLLEFIKQLPAAGIDTPHEQASFFAQIAHESAELTRLEENLNYSAERLPQVWPKRFALNPDAPAAQRQPNHLAFTYARQPALLASYVYGDRLGNGPQPTGDGWRYRGRGPIQITGRNNYTACAAATGFPLVEHPELLLQPDAGAASSLWFWQAQKLDEIDDDDDIAPETRRVNGGTEGLAQRRRYFEKAMALFQQHEVR